jgi:hypothetical protein
LRDDEFGKRCGGKNGGCGLQKRAALHRIASRWSGTKTAPTITMLCEIRKRDSFDGRPASHGAGNGVRDGLFVVAKAMTRKERGERVG